MARPLLITMAMAAAGAAAVVLLALLVVSGVSRPFDQAVIGLVRHPGMVVPLSPLATITELGSTWAVTAVALLLVPVAAAIGPWMHGLIGAAVVAGASLGNSALKALIARERPELLEPIVVERGFSFPSGHAALGMVAWGVLAVLVSRSRLPPRIRTVLVGALALLVILIGVSRVYLGVHFPTDVLAGWLAGAVVVFLYARLTRGVPMAPAVAAADGDPAAPRSGPPAPG